MDYKATAKHIVDIFDSEDDYQIAETRVEEYLRSLIHEPAKDVRELAPTAEEWRVSDADGYSDGAKTFVRELGYTTGGVIYYECMCWFDGYVQARLASAREQRGVELYRQSAKKWYLYSQERIKEADAERVRAELAESDLTNMQRQLDGLGEHSTWQAYYLSELERLLTKGQIDCARKALHERWQVVPRLDRAFPVGTKLEKAAEGKEK